jgi:glycosyltransferase involved in cell wall biosynthesis
MKNTILIQAPLFSRSGYGAHARAIVLDLFDSHKYNVSVAPTGWGGTSTTDNFPADVFDKLQFVVNNKVTQGSEFTFVHIGIPLEFQRVSPTINIGVTAGIESNKLPQGWAESCNKMDAVIVPSTFVRDLFVKEGVKVPVYAVGEGVDISIFHPEVECKLELSAGKPLDFETSFNFLSGGQWMQQAIGEDRKGFGLLVKWFIETFEDKPDVGLVLKTFMINNSSSDNYFSKERINQMKAGKPFPKIYLIHGDLKDEEMAQLYCHPKVKAFVSPTSGEGWGRMTAETVSCDLPVLVTGWSGHMDFVNKDFVTLFDYTIKDVPQGAWQRGLFEPGMQWAYVDEDDVKRKMRRCYSAYSIAKERAVKMGDIFRKNWSTENMAQKLIDVFETILAKSDKGIIISPSGIRTEKI